MPKASKKSLFSYISPAALTALKSGLCIVILQLSALWMTVCEAAAVDPYFAAVYYADAMPYVALTLCVVVLLSLSLDVVQKTK